MLRIRRVWFYSFFSVALAGLIAASAAVVFHRELRWSISYLTTNTTKEGWDSAPPALPSCEGCNVILVSLDTLRADHLGFLGSGKGLTPNLDRIAAASVVYQNAYANAFFTTPSHMTVFTSLPPQVHNVGSVGVKLPGIPRAPGREQKLDPRFETIASRMKAAGYRTIWNGPLELKHLSLQDGFERGFEQFHKSPFPRTFNLNLEDELKFARPSLSPVAKGQPKTFMFLHSYVTHMPFVYVPPDVQAEPSEVPFTRLKLLRRLKKSIMKEPEWLLSGRNRNEALKKATGPGHLCANFSDMRDCFSKFVSEDAFMQAIGQWQLRQIERFSSISNLAPVTAGAYASGVRVLDRQVGELWDELKKNGALENTLIVFMSDHGEELSDHGLFSHASFFEHTARVPLLIYHPKLPQGQRVKTLVSLIDIMPTILEVAGLPPSPQAQGVSLTKSRPPLVSGYSLGNDYVREGGWKLTRNHTGTEQLFYLPTDPEERENLVDLRLPFTRDAYERLNAIRKEQEIKRAL